MRIGLRRADDKNKAHAVVARTIMSAAISGYLRKPGRTFMKKRRFFRLRGTTLSSHRNESENGSWKVDIADAIVTGVGRHEIIIEVPDQRTLVLYTEDEASHDAWMEALQQAASRKFDTFYVMGRDIGRGPYTKVRLATHKKSCKHYAVKTVDKIAHSISYVETELKAMKVVEHPNLVRVVDFYDTKDKIFVVSDYMKGGSLYDTIARNLDSFNECTASHVMREILKAVAFLHREGFCHRNIKPANLLCSNGSFPETVRLCDYGWAAFMERACDQEEYFDKDVRTRTLITAPHFTAPEILFGTTGFGQAVDLWSCGVIMYTILSGKLPFDGQNKKEVVASIRASADGPPFPTEQWRWISNEARDLVKGLLSVNPSCRLSAPAALSHPWISTSKPHTEPIRNELVNLRMMPGYCLGGTRTPKLYSVDSSNSGHSAEGTYTITNETRRKMNIQKSKIMYGSPTTKMPDAGKITIETNPKRSSRGLARSSRGMSRLSRGLKKSSTFGLFSRKGQEGPKEYW